MQKNAKTIIALDLTDKVQIEALLKCLPANKAKLKIGKELFTLYGPDYVRELVARGYDIFLDLKFHDIPNTVAKACLAAASLGVWMLNVHALGGVNMLKAARQALDSLSGKKPLLIGVTILTSMDETDLKQIGLKGSVEDNVLRLAKSCHAAGLDGVVCSAKEVKLIKENVGQHFCCVTPGIRLADDSFNDQRRVLTPAAAIAAGADYLVIGRSITHAKDPLAALKMCAR